MIEVFAKCFKCNKNFKFMASEQTGYWLCSSCNTLNNCENSIKQINIDMIFDVVEIE